MKFFSQYMQAERKHYGVTEALKQFIFNVENIHKLKTKFIFELLFLKFMPLNEHDSY